MKFLADMGISQTTVKWLKGQGFYAVHGRNLNMHRASDPEILEKAKNDKCIVLTCDLDFGEILSASGEAFPSVIILRLEDETPEHVNKRLTQVLPESTEALLKGAIVVVEEGRHRIRRLPVCK